MDFLQNWIFCILLPPQNSQSEKSFCPLNPVLTLPGVPMWLCAVRLCSTSRWRWVLSSPYTRATTWLAARPLAAPWTCCARWRKSNRSTQEGTGVSLNLRTNRNTAKSRNSQWKVCLRSWILCYLLEIESFMCDHQQRHSARWKITRQLLKLLTVTCQGDSCGCSMYLCKVKHS